MCDGDLGRNVRVERDIHDSIEKTEKLEPTFSAIVQQQQQQLSLSFNQFVAVSVTEPLKGSHDSRDL